MASGERRMFKLKTYCQEGRKMDNTAFEVQREWHYTIVENHILEANLSTQAKLLYVILCKYANRNKECYPSYETLMRDISVKSKATLSNAIKELIEKGILEVVSGKEEGKSNVYIIKDNPLNWIRCSPNEQGVFSYCTRTKTN